MAAESAHPNWGQDAWTFLHHGALVYDERSASASAPDIAEPFVRAFGELLVCEPCRHHFGEMLLTSPPPHRHASFSVSSEHSLFIWFIDRHNEVNRRLGYAEMTHRDAYALYLSDRSMRWYRAMLRHLSRITAIVDTEELEARASGSASSLERTMSNVRVLLAGLPSFMPVSVAARWNVLASALHSPRTAAQLRAWVELMSDASAKVFHDPYMRYACIRADTLLINAHAACRVPPNASGQQSPKPRDDASAKGASSQRTAETVKRGVFAAAVGLSVTALTLMAIGNLRRTPTP